MAELISGKTLAAKLKAEAAAEAAELREKGVHARLAVVIVGENPASRTYVAGKAKDCAECGLLSDDAVVIAETAADGVPVPPDGWTAKAYRYGKTYVTILRRNGEGER